LVEPTSENKTLKNKYFLGDKTMIDTAQKRGIQTTAHQSSQTHASVTHTAVDDRQLSLIVGTANGLWILDDQPRVELEGSAIHAIASGENGLWAIVNRNSIWHRNLEGKWQAIASVDNLQLNCILSIDEMNTVLVGTSEAHLMQIKNGELQQIESFEQAEGREEWYTPWGGLPDVRSIAIGTSGEWYVNIHVGGILRSTDWEKTWKPTLDMHADVHEVRTVNDRPGLVVAATAEGLALSQDGGDSWEFDRSHLHATYARAIGVCEDTILMSVSMGPRGSKAAIYRRKLDQAGTFEKCAPQGNHNNQQPEWFSDNINTRCLATSGTAAAFGTPDGEVFYSTDAGLTWEAIVSDLPSIHCLTLVG
jgi:hypothetical protein